MISTDSATTEPSAKPRSSAFRSIQLLLAIPALLMIFGSSFMSLYATGHGEWRYLVDVDVYRQGAWEFWTGSDLYTKRFITGEIDLPFTYPPFGALIFTPLALLFRAVPMDAGQIIFSLLNFGFAIFVSIYAAKYAKLPLGWLGLLWVVAFAFVGEPTIQGFCFGQINLALISLVLFDVCRPTPSPKFMRFIPRGFLVGVAAAIKLTPAVFGLFYVVRKDWKGAAGVIGGFLFSTALAALIRPSFTWQYFTEVLVSTNRIGEPWYATNVSLTGLLARFTESKLPWLLAVLVVFAITAWATHAAQKRGEYLLALCSVALLGLLASPVSWSHHWVWLIPLIIGLWRYHYYFLAAWGLSAMTLMPFHAFLPKHENRELHWTALQHVMGAHYLIFAAVVLICVGAGFRLSRKRVDEQPYIPAVLR